MYARSNCVLSACSAHGACVSAEETQRRQSSRWRGSERAGDHRCGQCMASAVRWGVGALWHAHLDMPGGVLLYSGEGCTAADFGVLGRVLSQNLSF